ncbi:MAG: iron transporter FeoB [Bacillota bacterium]|nr:iron transporter FeoB [Bacillota bacterium]
MSIPIPGTTIVYVPEYITVHLGRPDEPAENVTIPFIDYIKNVASSELYPTWPENALRANIYAIISIALNRVYTEWYRSRGYKFDITNSTQYDQFFVKDRGIFDPIEKIVDEIFNDYIVRQGQIVPLFTTYCDGRVSECNGMYQWGTVDLAKQGLGPYDILTYYYGDDINIRDNAPVGTVAESYPGSPLKVGSIGTYVLYMQLALNTISNNYPAIPKIYPVNGVFTTQMEQSVKAFQRIFNLTPDGIIGKGTWYSIRNTFIAVRNLAELTSKGAILGEVDVISPEVEARLVIPRVQLAQYFLNVMSIFQESIPAVDINGQLGPPTRASIIEFQKIAKLPVTGILDEETWLALYNSAIGALRTIPPNAIALPRLIYPNIIYRLNSEGPGVYVIEQYLAFISQFVPSITAPTPDNVFKEDTRNAVIAFQKAYGLSPDGIVGRATWDKLTEIYYGFKFGNKSTVS